MDGQSITSTRLSDAVGLAACRLCITFFCQSHVSRKYYQMLVNQLAHRQGLLQFAAVRCERWAVELQRVRNRATCIVCGDRQRSCCRWDATWNTIGCPLLLQSLQTRTCSAPLCYLSSLRPYASSTLTAHSETQNCTWQPSIVSSSPPLIFRTICLNLSATSPVLRLF